MIKLTGMNCWGDNKTVLYLDETKIIAFESHIWEDKEIGTAIRMDMKGDNWFIVKELVQKIRKMLGKFGYTFDD